MPTRLPKPRGARAIARVKPAEIALSVAAPAAPIVAAFIVVVATMSVLNASGDAWLESARTILSRLGSHAAAAEFPLNSVPPFE